MPEGGAASRGLGPFQLGFPLSQLEAALRDKSQQLEGLQELKVTLEEQLKKETAAKVMWRPEHGVAGACVGGRGSSGLCPPRRPRAEGKGPSGCCGEASAALGHRWGPSPRYAQPEASPGRTASAVPEGPVSRERLPRHLSGRLPSRATGSRELPWQVRGRPCCLGSSSRLLLSVDQPRSRGSGSVLAPLGQQCGAAWPRLPGPQGGLCSQTAAEQLVFEEKNKAQRLQTELDVSEQVQRDFVKLSQTLQVRPVATLGPSSLAAPKWWWAQTRATSPPGRCLRLVPLPTPSTAFLPWVPCARPRTPSFEAQLGVVLPGVLSAAMAGCGAPADFGPGGRLNRRSGGWKQPSKLALHSCALNSAVASARPGVGVIRVAVPAVSLGPSHGSPWRANCSEGPCRLETESAWQSPG